MSSINSIHTNNTQTGGMNSNPSSDNLERISIFRMTEFLPKKNRPIATAFNQQKMTTLFPPLKPYLLVALLALIGSIFLPVGNYLIDRANAVYESKIIYDGSDINNEECKINYSNEMKKCNLNFTFSKDINEPIYVYYELTNYYQNHKRYFQSRSMSQLWGEDLSYADVDISCIPLTYNGTDLLNPCGLVANSFFTDMFNVTSNHYMDETNIALPQDKEIFFKQVNGFEYRETNTINNTCLSLNLPTSCKDYKDIKTGKNYKYYYPNDNTVQYLYESYPLQISPIKGVTDEHFIVWMRTSSLPTFRKLYGKIDAVFKKGDVLSFDILANFEVDSFRGTKSIIISTVGDFGGKNTFSGHAYMIVGIISLILSMCLGIIELISL